ncbi:histidinol dehydrogenase [Aureivirga sp. CE67]|uniref:histidinol dehydrogenase n=1 Tax=Aureivirga sp. CE67 TaxID=1788983 RepID=UPI0018CAE851|nr:histidinol dehydrogenase [Aureivirga sp. CE67]
MKTYLKPKKKDWDSICERPKLNSNRLETIVREIIKDVKVNKNEALIRYGKLLDGVNISNLKVSNKEINNAKSFVSRELKNAIQVAYQNIYKFHSSQKQNYKTVETIEGVKCWQKDKPIENVGLYIPGGSAPLFSTILMLGIPAKIAGCKNITICTPPNSKNEINPIILFTANMLGIKNIYKVGGAQAIAAMSLGTESIPKVDKIFGPGNQYVTKAKEICQQFGTAIDMPAGPSEVLVIADKTSNPQYIAADLLSQAEHGEDSQVVLVSTSEGIIDKTLFELEKQTKQLDRKRIVEKSIQNSKAILVKDINVAFELSNYYAPEHLIVATENAVTYQDLIENAGSVFLGKYSCESAGDYASGTNHTLPTNGFAKNYSGVSLDSFIKKITFQEITAKGIQNLGNTIEIMAEAEGLMAHKNAVSVRLNSI